MDAVYYPRLVKRVRAVLIDSVVVPVVAITSLGVGYGLGVTDFLWRALLVGVPVFILEPGLVTITGGTVGHHLVGIRVQRKHGSGNLNIIAATVRTIAKYFLGWLSFVFVFATTKHQAIHDLLAGSVVVHRDAAGLPQHDVLTERRIESDRFVYPPKWRRALVTFVYWIVMTLTLMTAFGFLISEECGMRSRCTVHEWIATLVAQVAWLAATGAIVLFGWSGRLPGARRRLVPTA